MKFTGAFIIPSALYKNENYLYFGLEKSTKEVSAFGGKREKKENIQGCAVREFREESLGVFAKDSSIKKRLADQAKYHVKKVDKDNTCVHYFVPLKLKNNPLSDFMQRKSAGGLKRSQKEMARVIAVKATDVIRAVNSTPAGAKMYLSGNPVRPVLSYVLREGVNNGYIR